MEENFINFVTTMSCGNPGALAAIMEIVSGGSEYAPCAIERMKYFGITGDKFYMIWNDCCNRDTEKTLKVMIENSKEDILTHLNYENGRGIPYEN